jgi:hypothetical protein
LIKQHLNDPSVQGAAEHFEDDVSTARDEEMIQALYLMHKTYLGLSSASVSDFTAIMADFYCCQELSARVKDEQTSRSQGAYEAVKSRDGGRMGWFQQQDVFDEDFNSIISSPSKLSRAGADFISRKRARRLSESPLISQALRKLPKKPDCEILSQPINFEVPVSNSRKTQAAHQRGLWNFVYSPQFYLNDLAQQISSMPPVSPKVMFWCRCEWFYSYIDRGFFAHNDFEECLKVILKYSEEELTLRQWRTTRALMGKPRRFSPYFVHQERERLGKFCEAIKVLQQGKVLPSHYHDMLPYININLGGVSSRLMVGQRVLGIHPKTGQVKSGLILTLDSNCYHVQFDAPELGVCFLSDTEIVPLYTGEEPKVEAELNSVPEQRVSRDRFKAGVNIYAMSFILKLLERKEALLELLKTFNLECSEHLRNDPTWRPHNDFQQQYAWIGVCIQAINMAIAPVLDVFRLREQPIHQTVSVRPFEQLPTHPSPLDQLGSAASVLLSEKEEALQNRNLSLRETQQMQGFLRKSLMLMFALEQFKKDKSEPRWANVQELLNDLTPACESNRRKYDQLVATVGELGQLC